MSVNSRLARLVRRIPPQRDPEFPWLTPAQADDARAARESEEHFWARAMHQLGEGPAPGELSAETQAWKARQPPLSAEESADLLARLKRLSGEDDPDREDGDRGADAGAVPRQ